jgi:hypothetical protein
MADDFDPYYVWLGIPPEEQPADHYRLLGIRRFEENAEAISSALDQRTQFLRSLQVGKRSPYSQKLLNEISAAGGCLLDSKRKANYDQRLRQSASALPAKTVTGPKATPVRQDEHPAPTAVISAPPPIDLTSFHLAGSLTALTPSQRSGSRSALPVIVGSVIAVATLVATLIVVAALGGFASKSPDKQLSVASTAPSVSNSTPNPAPPPRSGAQGGTAPIAAPQNKVPDHSPPALPTVVGPAVPPSTSAPAGELFAWWDQSMQRQGVPALHVGTGASAYLPQSASLVRGDQPFTAEMWVRWGLGSPSAESLLATFSKEHPSGWALVAMKDASMTPTRVGLALQFCEQDGKTVEHAAHVEHPERWHHVALMVDSQNMSRLMVDGRLLLEVPPIKGYRPGDQNIRIGAEARLDPSALRAEVCGIRLSRGFRYDQSFVPPPPRKIDADGSTLLIAEPDALLSQASGASAWQYGAGRYDPATRLVSTFTPFAKSAGDYWQVGSEMPDPGPAGWLRLEAKGGHPGNDWEHSSVRRWTAPAAGKLTITGRLRHDGNQGDGVRAYVASNRAGLFGDWRAFGSQQDTSAQVAVEPGHTIDFIVDCADDWKYDQFFWTVNLRLTDDRENLLGNWNSEADFTTASVATTPTARVPAILSGHASWSSLGTVPLTSSLAQRLRPGVGVTQHPRVKGAQDKGSAFVSLLELDPPIGSPARAPSLFEWKSDPSANAVAAGYLKVEEAGRYKFNANAFYDRTALYVDGELVCPFRDGEATVREIDLLPGYVPITSIAYVESPDPIRVQWQPPNQSVLSPIPEKLLFSEEPHHFGSDKIAAKTGREPVPSPAAIQHAKTKIDHLFEADIKAAKSVKARLALAEKLLILAGQTTDDPAMHFVLLSEAERLAIEVKNLEIALNAVERLAREFEVDPLGERIQLLDRYNREALVAPQRSELLQEAIDTGYESLEAEQSEATRTLVGVIKSVVTKSVSADTKADAKAFLEIAAERLRRSETIRNARTTMEKSPDDPLANTLVGLHLLFAENAPEKGLPLLIKGNNEKLAAAAKARQASATEGAATTLQEADLWYASISTAPSDFKSAVRQRALDCYTEVVAQSRGLEKNRIEQRQTDLLAEIKSSDGDLRRPRVRMRDLPETSPGMIGRLFIDGKDARVLVIYETGRSIDTAALTKLLNDLGAKGGRIILEGTLSCPTARQIKFEHHGRARGPLQVVSVNGKQVNAIGSKSSDPNNVTVQLFPVGNHVVQWAVDYDGLTASHLRVLNETAGSEPFQLHFTRQQQYDAKKRPTTAELQLGR